jgi:hypothetical protein
MTLPLSEQHPPPLPPEDVEELALVLVDALDLHVKQRVRVDVDPQLLPNVRRKPLLRKASNPPPHRIMCATRTCAPPPPPPPDCDTSS